MIPFKFIRRKTPVWRGLHLESSATGEGHSREGNPDKAAGRSEIAPGVAGAASMGGWALSLPGEHLHWSDEVALLHGVAAGTRPSLADALSCYAPSCRKRIGPRLEACLREGVPFDEEAEILAKQGQSTWVRIIGRAVRNTGGDIVRIQGTVQDITDRRRAEEKAKRLADRLSATLESITDALFTVDREWRFTYINAEAERLLLRERKELLGKNLWTEFADAVGTVFEREYQRAVRDNCTVAFEEFYPALQSWMDVRAYPSDEGLAVYFRDVTEQKRIHRALLEGEKRFKNVARAVTDTIWDWDIVTDTMWWNEGMNLVFGYTPKEIGESSEAWLSRLHPDDRDRVATALHAVIDGNEENWSDEYRFMRRDGSYAFVLDRGFVIRDSEGKALRMVGGMADLSERKQAEESARRAAEVQAGIADTLQRIAAENLDLQGALDLMARRTQELTGADGSAVELIEGDETVYRATAGMTTRQFGRRLRQTHSLSGYAARNNTAVCCHDYETDERVDLVACAELGARSIIVAPLRAGTHIIGTLKAMASRRAAFTATDLSNLKILAESLGAIIQRHQALDQLRHSEAQYRLMFHGNPHPMWVYATASLQFLAINSAAIRHYGFSEQEFLGMTLKDIRSAEDAITLEHAVSAAVQGLHVPSVFRHRKKDGSEIMVEITSDHIEFNGVDARIVLASDVTERLRAEREIQKLAFYDPLTGLPNRLLLLDRLQQAMANSARNRTAAALLFVDLDNFKVLNDTLGHDKGDILLRQVGVRLQACARETDTAARFGGDEFVVLQEDLPENCAEAGDCAMLLAQRILAAFQATFLLHGEKYYCTPSIGIAVFNGHDVSVDEILKRADMAMYQAKSSGRNTVRFFDPEMQVRVSERAAMEAALRKALDQNEFVLHYQPQIGQGDRICGAEALVRWQHPQRGMISPAEFIPLAEEAGLILPLGVWVLETACAQLSAWDACPTTADLSLSVNVSASQFRAVDFVDRVLDIVERTGADPARLKLELTESLMVDDIEVTIAKMAALRKKGIRFSLDDFGTGYSSLAYLKRLPLDQLKIDQSFVRDVLTDPNDAAIVRMVIVLGQTLGLSVIAEGVETRLEQEFLAEQGCSQYQGYLFGRPVPAAQFEEMVRQRTRAPAQ
jgi:diguanylate cyclase (GGDEF)-like protein/PAS domain S-box-containing protein